MAFLPVVTFGLAWLFAGLGWDAPGVASGAPFDQLALNWMLYLALGWTAVGAAVTHTVFARQTAASIGWQTSGFQYEVGFANLAVGLAGIYAAYQSEPAAHVAGAIAGSVFLFCAGCYHIVEIVRDRNYEPGNTVILISDFGVPASLLALLIATNAI